MFNGALHSFSIKNVFYDKIDSRIFYFHVAIYRPVVFHVIHIPTSWTRGVNGRSEDVLAKKLLAESSFKYLEIVAKVMSSIRIHVTIRPKQHL